MLIPIAIGAAGLLGGLFTYAATRPDTFRVQRSTLVHAPPEAIAPHLTDFRRWSAWSPYDKLDPGMKKEYGGAASGPGAVYAWDSRKAGAGRMEIREASARRVVIQMDFIRPFKANNTTEFTLEPEGAATRVTWAMHGPQPFVARLMCVFIDMDRLVGKDFVAGLASLKAVAESPASGPVSTAAR
jgi:hypothetical protein